ncbi:thermonuclease family protein [Mesorhizobium sp. CAU 1741]|uniref:thermonuclease family protein n=1 Tax=Mesorhizobium sp. CAU 1741 TaxID=3140366 RepID=UPI00325C0EEB
MRRFGKRRRSYTLKEAGLPDPMRARKREAGVLRSLWVLTLAAGIGAVAASEFGPGQALSFVQSFLPASQSQSQSQPATLVGLVRPMPFCGGGRRVSCVVDGDTFWLSGEKVRLESIDAPEMEGACSYERNLAQQAKSRLSEILSNREITLSRSGHDRYGRTLARADTPSGEAGAILVREGLARRWTGRREPWCT